MTGKTVTRAQLTEAVYREVGLSRNESADLVESVLNEISDALSEGETVKISSFGSFLCGKKVSASGGTRKPAKRCRSCRARSLSSGQAMY